MHLPPRLLLHCWKLSSVSGANGDSDINNRKNSGAAEARWLKMAHPKMAQDGSPQLAITRLPLITRCVPLRDVSPREAASTERLPNRCASSPPDDQPNFSAYRPRKISLCTTWFVYTNHQYHQYSIELAYCTLAPACRFSCIRVPACSRYTSWDRAARSTC